MASPPKNFAISETIIDPTKMVSFYRAGGLFEHYQNQIHGDNIYAAWADNSDSPAPFFNMLPVFRRGEIKHCKDRTKLKFHDQIKIPYPRYSSQTFIAEYTLSVNPTDPGNLNMCMNCFDIGLPAPFYTENLISASFDHGKTWTTKNWNTVVPGLVMASDVRQIFDKFGNGWNCAMAVPVETGSPPLAFALAVSIDGGLTYKPVGSIPPPAGFDYGFDYPQMAFGSDGSDGFGLYVTVDLIDNASNTLVPSIIFTPVLGRGNFGTPVLYQLSTLTNLVAWGNPLVNDKGDVYIAYINFPAPGVGFANLLVTIPGGIIGISNGNIMGPFLGNFAQHSSRYPNLDASYAD